MAIYYAIASGPWNGQDIWSASSGGAAGAGPPGAGDTAILNAASGAITVTITAAASVESLNMTGFTGTLNFSSNTLTLGATAQLGATLAGVMNSNGGTLLVEGGGVNLQATVTGTLPTLKLSTAAQTMISNGFTWNGPLNLGFAGTITLNSGGQIWTNGGLVTVSANTTLNATTTETLTCQGGINVNAATLGGTAGVILTGGTWIGGNGNALSNSLTFAGNVTVSGTVVIANNLVTYSSGVITTTGSTLQLQAATLNTAGIVWNNIQQVGGGTFSVTLTSALTMTGTFSNSAADGFSFAGAYPITMGTLATAEGLGLAPGQTLYITKSINVSGITINSNTANSPTYINYTGTLANQLICNTNFTDVQFTGNVPMYDYGSSTLTRTSNIIKVTPTSLNTLGVLGAGTVTQNSAQALSPNAYCVQLNPNSSSDYLYWSFLVPVVQGINANLSFYQMISTGFTGTMAITVYNTDNATVMISNQNIPLTNNGVYNQYEAPTIAPISTGFLLVILSITGASTGSVYIDSVTA